MQLDRSKVKNVLVFESDEFSLEAPLNDRGVRYDLPLGDDIAAYLKTQLESRSADWEMSDPVGEDFGAVLMLSREKNALTITMSWQGDNWWAMVFAEQRGCIGWLFNRQPGEQAQVALLELKRQVNDIVICDEKRFRNPQWINDDEFPGLASCFLIPYD